MSQVTKRWHLPALVLVLLLMICSAAIAQVINGTITGEVRDSSGAIIPKATVTVEDKSIGVHQVTTTDNQGVFYFPSLPKGTYSITVAAAGFKQLDKVGIPLSNGDHINAGEFALPVGGSKETVTVEADAGQIQIQSQSAERSDVITGAQLNDLGMNGRMILDYLKVIPGVNSTFNGAQSSKGGLGNISVNGGRGGMTGFTIDGVNNVDNGCNCSTQITINPDAVGEVKVLTSNFQAEYGKAAAGTISVTTKGGENQFHGNLRWFHRHEGFNAEQWYDKQANAVWRTANPDSPISNEPNPKQKYRYNYFGGQIGGPVLIPGTNFNKNKDKLFFFFNQEWYRQLLPDGFDKVYVPTEAELNGDFSQSHAGNGARVTIHDANGNPYPGNLLPNVNTNMQAALKSVYPRPRTSDLDPRTTCQFGQCYQYNYITNKTTTHPRREDIGRLDYQINSANRAYFSFANNDGTQSLPEGLSPQGISNFAFPGGMKLNEPGYSTVLHVTSTLTPTMVNDASFGWSVNIQQINSVNNNVLASKYNLNIPLVYPVAANSPIPDFSFGARTDQNATWSYLGSLPWNNALTVINFNDNLSKMVGKHMLKFGVLVERSRKDQSSWGNANGTFNFSTSNSNLPAYMDTGDSYANALLGNYTSFQQQNGRPRGFYRYYNIEFFAQDTFKVTSRLTLDYGMRFAWVQPQYDAKNQVSYFDPAAWDPTQAVRLYKPTPADGGKTGYDPVTGASVLGNMIGDIVPGSGNRFNGMVSAAAGGYAGGYQNRWFMPEPRIGFAYDLTGASKYVVRGGFGISHDRFQGNPVYNLAVGNINGADPTFYGGTIAGLPSLAAAAPMAPYKVYGFDKTGKVPTVYSYSLGFQADLGWKTMLDVAYVGNVQRHLSQKHNLNAIPYGTMFTYAAQDPSKYGDNNHVVKDESSWIGSAWTSRGFHYMGDNAYSQVFLAPYQGYGDIEYWTWDGNASYNSLQISAHRRFGNNLTFGAAYTFSKTLDSSSSDGAWTSILPNGVRRFNYGLASFDRPHNFVFNYVYSLPKFSKYLGGSKFLSYLTDGYQWEGLAQFIKGTPGTAGTNFTNDGWYIAPYITGSWTESPNTIVVSSPTKGNGGNPYSHLNPNAFALPEIGTSVPTARNYYRSGGTNNFDMSVYKNIPFGSRESQYLQLRAEAFNVFNHPQFWGVNTDMGSPNTNGCTSAWGCLFGNWNAGWANASPVQTSKLRPAGQKGNIGNYFGEYKDGGNARVLQLAVKLYF